MSQTAQCRRLEGKVAIVTAATAGIGQSIAERLGQEGARVFICSRYKREHWHPQATLLLATLMSRALCVHAIRNNNFVAFQEAEQRG